LQLNRAVHRASRLGQPLKGLIEQSYSIDLRLAGDLRLRCRDPRARCRDLRSVSGHQIGALSASYQMVSGPKRFRPCGFADDRSDVLRNDHAKVLDKRFAALDGMRHATSHL
jgi:hypothetical protein